jgi:hypothetical protein
MLTFKDIRWPDGVFCPHCGAWPPERRRNRGARKLDAFRCRNRECFKEFSVRSKTWHQWLTFAEEVYALGDARQYELRPGLDIGSDNTFHRMWSLLQRASGCEGQDETKLYDSPIDVLRTLLGDKGA